MPRIVPLAAALTLAAGLATPAPAAAGARETGPALTEPRQRMADALHCRTAAKPNGREPVLLLHGITATGAEEFEWSWVPALLAEGYHACTVDLPDRGMEDNQRAAEYVVHAVRAMAARFNNDVDIVGSSQGPMTARWALRFWPDVRAEVDDFVALAGIGQGSDTAEFLCARGECPRAVWQWRRDSAFIRALNTGDQTPGDVDHTSLSTKADLVVFPQVPRSMSDVEGAVNVAMDELCPGRTPDHVQMIFDAVAHAAAMDALVHDGPFDPERFDPAACAEVFMPGVSPTEAMGREYLLYAEGVPMGAGLTWPTVDAEPALRTYATDSHHKRS